MTPTLDPTIANPTEQQVFDAAVRHLAAQGSKCRPAETEDDVDPVGCAYRNGDFTKACAVGALLTDDECRSMDKHYLTVPVSSLYANHLVPDRIYPHRHLLRELQTVHDCHEVQSWERELRYIAEHHGLERIVLDECYPPQ
jgi:hypothetical protein